MDWWYVIGIAFGLAMDAFAVAIAAGLAIRKINARHIFRLAFHFGLFQFVMPVLGWLAGQTLHQWISAFDHWIAFVLLGFIGGKMIWESFGSEEHRGDKGDPTRGWLLLTLSIATSIDALAVGLSLAFLRVSIWGPSVVIGIVAAGMTALGMTFGSRLGARFGKWAERAGGLVLAGIGVRILVSHLCSA
ncbi:MAG: manganese efflux pump [Planctomycetes bacterium]|nr:manganese efflux pump [Planctomycetota bacterium]